MNTYQKVILIFFLTAASVIATFITPEANLLKNLFSINNSKLSYLMSLYLVGYLAGQGFFTFFSKKYNAILSIKAGFLISIIGIYFQDLSVQCLNYDLFLIGRFLSAFGLSSGLVCGFVIIKNNIIEQNEEKRYLSVLAISFTGAIYFSILISGMLIKYFTVSTILKYEIYYICLLFLLAFFIPDTEKKKNIESKYHQFINIKLISYSLVLSITTVSAYCYSIYAPLIMLDHFGLTVQSYAYFNFINMLGLFFGSTVYRKINTHINEIYIMAFSLLMIALLSLILIQISTKVPLLYFVVLFFLINLLSGLIYPAATFKSMECGSCKQSSSTTMNIIKIGMPSVAVYTLSIFQMEAILCLSTTICFFSVLFLMILIISESKMNHVALQ